MSIFTVEERHALQCCLDLAHHGIDIPPHLIPIAEAAFLKVHANTDFSTDPKWRPKCKYCGQAMTATETDNGAGTVWRNERCEPCRVTYATDFPSTVAAIGITLGPTLDLEPRRVDGMPYGADEAQAEREKPAERLAER